MVGNDLVQQFKALLSDENNLPAQFKSWVTKWVETNPPNTPLSQVPGYALATSYVEATTPGAVASGTVPVTVAWTAVRKNNAAMWATGSNTKLTAKTAGVYQVSAFIDWGTNAVGIRRTWIRLNGTTNIAGDSAAPTAQGAGQSCSGLIDLQVGDYVEVTAIQNSGGSITPSGFFTAVRVSPL